MGERRAIDRSHARGRGQTPGHPATRVSPRSRPRDSPRRVLPLRPRCRRGAPPASGSAVPRRARTSSRSMRATAASRSIAARSASIERPQRSSRPSLSRISVPAGASAAGCASPTPARSTASLDRPSPDSSPPAARCWSIPASRSRFVVCGPGCVAAVPSSASSSRVRRPEAPVSDRSSGSSCRRGRRRGRRPRRRVRARPSSSRRGCRRRGTS